jgi:uncharacterized membrane protein YfcA
MLIALLLAAPAAAEPTRETPKASSTTKRVIWTAIGAGAGFAAGVFIGLNKFDDAVYADRKIWTTAIVGAAAGGVAGALLSRNVGRQTPVKPERATRSTDVPNVTWSDAIRSSPLVIPPPQRQP